LGKGKLEQLRKETSTRKKTNFLSEKTKKVGREEERHQHYHASQIGRKTKASTLHEKKDEFLEKKGALTRHQKGRGRKKKRSVDAEQKKCRPAKEKEPPREESASGTNAKKRGEFLRMENNAFGQSNNPYHSEKRTQ